MGPEVLRLLCQDSARLQVGLVASKQVRSVSKVVSEHLLELVSVALRHQRLLASRAEDSDKEVVLDSNNSNKRVLEGPSPVQRDLEAEARHPSVKGQVSVRLSLNKEDLDNKAHQDSVRALAVLGNKPVGD